MPDAPRLTDAQRRALEWLLDGASWKPEVKRMGRSLDIFYSKALIEKTWQLGRKETCYRILPAGQAALQADRGS